MDYNAAFLLVSQATNAETKGRQEDESSSSWRLRCNGIRGNPRPGNNKRF